MHTLNKLLEPRESVLLNKSTDVVLNLDQLQSNKIDAKAFFAENYVTKGMADLYRNIFKRFEEKDDAFLFTLKQSMGGGKTHNIIALGLLAKYPSLRDTYMKEYYDTSLLDSIRIVTVNGRDDHEYGIWGTIAHQLGKKEQLNNYYQPLAAPGRNAWVELLKGDKTLIVMDELPPYFFNARSTSIGDATLADVTTTALANLFNAGSELSNIVIVLTDLGGQYYEEGQGINKALELLKDESQRFSRTIEPVNQSTGEIYQILRTRLFKALPDKQKIEDIAQNYVESLKRAKQLELVEDNPEKIRERIIDSYPFHPATRDLMARFKENPGFQKTRGLIRFWRTALSQMFHKEHGWADERDLIAPYDFDLNDSDTRSTVLEINPSLENAISHDIADQGNAVSEKIASDKHNSLSIWIGRLILFSSLSRISNQVKGLKQHEILAILAAPNVEIEEVNQLIGELRQQSWYMHIDKADNILFKNVQNVVSKMHDYQKGFTTESNKQEARNAILRLFKPTEKDLYGSMLALPAIDEIKLDQNRVTLVVSEHSGGNLNPDLRTFWEQTPFRNRLIVLSGDPMISKRIYSHISSIRALKSIIEEFTTDNVPTSDPQYKEADELLSRSETSFYSAVNHAFTTLYFPTKERRGSFVGKGEIQFQFKENRLDGEDQIKQLLISKSKFNQSPTEDTFRKEIESKLFGGQQSVAFNDLLKRAAQRTDWPFHHPKALENMQHIAEQQGYWRIEGSHINKGPFPKEKTGLSVQPKARDEKTGARPLMLIPLHGDTVYWEQGEGVTEASSKIEDLSKPFELKDMVVSFLCVDSKNEHETGAPYVYKNTLELKHRFKGTDDDRRCELESVPQGATIYYTTDGSDPKEGGVYEGSFPVPKGTQLVRAIATLSDVWSSAASFKVPQGSNAITISDDKAYIFEYKLNLDSNRELYEWLEAAEQYDVVILDFECSMEQQKGGKGYVSFEVMDVTSKAGDIKSQIDQLREIYSFDAKLFMKIKKLRFNSGVSFKSYLRGQNINLDSKLATYVKEI